MDIGNETQKILRDAERSEAEFAEGLKIARERSGDSAERYEAAKRNLNDRQSEHQNVLNRLSEIETKVSQVLGHETTLQNNRSLIAEFYIDHSLEALEDRSVEGVESFLQIARNALIEVERNLAVVESSKNIDLIADKEIEVSELREKASKASIDLERRKRAHVLAQGLERAVSRTSNEIVDERLAELAPLFAELYERLQPHPDWKSIDYGIRGDIRKFLSLKVGDDLDPQFMFSSGQRRVTGLAFLLTVHLTRPWCLLDTLLLDDPVQHIDDFRAIQLVELVASLSREGRQVVVAIEDEALSDLLSRRLSGAGEAKGLRYKLKSKSKGSVSIQCSEIYPMPENVIELSAGK